MIVSACLKAAKGLLYRIFDRLAEACAEPVIEEDEDEVPEPTLIGYTYASWLNEDKTPIGYATYYFYRDQDGSRSIAVGGHKPYKHSYYVKHVIPWVEGLRDDNDLYMYERASKNGADKPRPPADPVVPADGSSNVVSIDAYR